MTLASASVLITTRNRKEELCRAIESALMQAFPAEVLVIDDGSMDGTSEMVLREFPRVRLIRHDDSRGCVVRRNQGIRAATGDVVVSIDDDAVFSSPHIVGQTLGDFVSERIGAVAIPYIDIARDGRVRQQAPDSRFVYVSDSYIGTAHAVRRDVFLRLRGYREHLVHQGEEGDFCIRMLSAGYIVRLGTADPVHHLESPKRDLRRMDYYGARNAVLFAWQNVPAPFLLAHLPVTTIRCLLHNVQPSRLKTRSAGLLAGYVGILQGRLDRSPVSGPVYAMHRKLKKSGPRSLDAVIIHLPFWAGHAEVGVAPTVAR